MKNYLFIFRRDLRIEDNTAINWLLDNDINISFAFIYDRRQIDQSNNEYFSHKSVQFLSESLYDLQKNINKITIDGLNFFYGITEEVIEDIIINNQIDGIAINEDYTPFSIKRDNKIMQICKNYDIDFRQFMDIPLFDFKKIKTKKGDAYKRFKWFFETTKSMNVPKPRDLRSKITKLNKLTSKFNCEIGLIKTKYTNSDSIFVNGGRSNGILLMNEIKNLKDYMAVRQTPIIQGKRTSSHLSAYNKYGCISIRELFNKISSLFGREHELIRQLIWRDFYYNLVYYFPNSFINSNSYLNKFPWNNNPEIFKQWCEGKTGFPFVDASMRQLNQEGYMSNRGRLCCSSFLIKNLHIDWRKGEKYFANKLVDYDPSQNNGNWQWVSSTGYESQAYYRFINPDKDLIKFDINCLYVKKYIPELIDIDCKNIHRGVYPQSGYPNKIVDISATLSDYKQKAKMLKPI